MRKIVDIIGYTDSYKGKAFDGNKEIIVDQALLHEKVDVDTVINGKEIIGKVIKIIDKSPARVNPICPLFGKCGGCQLQHLKYSEQLIAKTNNIKNLFSETLKIDIHVNDCIGMNNPYNYRNKNQIAFQNDQKKRIISGFYEDGTHKIVDFERCYIEDEVSDKIIKSIKELMIKMHLSAYDEDRHFGLVRHVLIKRSSKTNEVLVVIITPSENFPGRSNFIKALLAKHPEITSIVQNINPRSTSIVLGDKELILYGKGYINDILCNKKFKISPRSFYQVNHEQAEKLYIKALELAQFNKTDQIIDAYSGVGTIGIIASEYVSKVMCVELSKDAHDDAITNAKTNNVKNVRFFNEDASNFIVNVAKRKEKIDGIIMDPPRSGSNIKFLDAILKLEPTKVVYISCEPKTQVLDLKHLLSKYKITNIQPVDMFPQTKNVECVVCLERK